VTIDKCNRVGPRAVNVGNLEQCLFRCGRCRFVVGPMTPCPGASRYYPMFHIWAGSLALTPPSVGVARSRTPELARFERSHHHSDRSLSWNRLGSRSRCRSSGAGLDVGAHN
jgi:hypothetical protein